MYNNEPQLIDIVLGGSEKVAFNNTMPSLNMTPNPANDIITITEDGIYEINWNLLTSASVGILTTFGIRKNGNNLDETEFDTLVSVSAMTRYSGSVIVSLVAGDVIDMSISALLAVSLTLATGTNATLTIKKIANEPNHY